MNLSEGCPHEFIEGLSNEFYRRLSNTLNKVVIGDCPIL